MRVFERPTVGVFDSLGGSDLVDETCATRAPSMKCS